MFLSRRYHAPADDGGMLIDPPLSELGHIFHSKPSPQFVNRISLADFRANARRDTAIALRDYYKHCGRVLLMEESDHWIFAGHQPNLFHPGVWLKNFVLHQISRRYQAIPLNLIVDNDEVKSNALKVPTLNGAIEAIPFAPQAAGIPYEEWSLEDEPLFRSLPGKLRGLTKDWSETPIAFPFWEQATQVSHSPLIWERFAEARRHAENRWLAGNFELPVSSICQTTAFAVFVDWIIYNLPKFRECYNGVVHEYRRAHGIRSVNHPVSDLAENEAPFWTWTKDNPRRRPLFVRPGWRLPAAIIRPRALTLTMFVRLALSDIFIHGIGGAKYDELTDAIAERFFGVKLTPYMVVSGTLRLPFALQEPADIHQLERQRRALMWNPQRVLRSAAPELAAQRDQLLRMPTGTKAERRDRTRALRENLERWKPLIAKPLTQLDQAIDAARNQRAVNQVLQSREHPFVLFPEERLRTWFSRIK